MQPQVVHEAEVHRQHVRLKIPISIEIDGTAFTVDDWSMGGFGIMADMTSRQPGERFGVKLVFPFEDFDVTLRLDCQMVYILEDSSRFGCRFLALSQGKVAAVTTDSTILLGLKNSAPNPEDYAIVGEYISDEPYGLGLPENDSDFRDLVNRTLVDLWNTGDYLKIYNKWFGQDTNYYLPLNWKMETWPY